MLSDYLPAQNAWLIVEDAGELLASLADLEGQAEQLGRDLKAAGDIPDIVLPPYFVANVLVERLTARPVIYLGHTTLANGGAPRNGDAPVARNLADKFHPGPRFGGQVRAILTEIESPLHSGELVVMVSRQAPRLAELLREHGHAIVPIDEIPQPPPPGLSLVQGVMEEGWKLDLRTNGKSEDGETRLPRGWFLRVRNLVFQRAHSGF